MCLRKCQDIFGIFKNTFMNYLIKTLSIELTIHNTMRNGEVDYLGIKLN